MTSTSTQTSSFGSGRREGHDASAFYQRFVAPEVSDDTTVNRCEVVDVIHECDARDLSAVPDSSVALVVTSPPYFAGKEYEQTLGENGVPASYFEYLQLLGDVFAECRRVLEPGGRIAVNVANLGRRPYRSLSGDVTSLFADLGFLLRGEVIWWKGRAAGGSCAWGSFQRPANPVLRDVTERVVIASKGRFDRALKPRQRHDRGLPSTATISRDEFMEATTDLWELPTESATRVGHPAPFPVELPQRLIELYTYEGDVVLDPFMGSGTTAVAALRTGRHYIGFETDEAYTAAARERIGAEAADPATPTIPITLPAVPVVDGAPADAPADTPAGALARAVGEGRQVKDVVAEVLAACGFTDVQRDVKQTKLGIELDFVAHDQTGQAWAFDVSGGLTTSRSGFRQSDTLWKALSTASILHHGSAATGTQPRPGARPLVLITTDAPARNTAGARALRAVTGPGRPVFGVVELLADPDQAQLCSWAQVGPGG